ncbi:Universal stress protein [Musa troglodytarum]|uniref:Universal stress protein n=1 Tax=Musa troglodytarum TaxID=320322 RepID=A0A9E7I552_9LILI|nr:Universal stress protein [Musa troglodytarum]
MNPQQTRPEPDRQASTAPPAATVAATVAQAAIQPSSPRFFLSSVAAGCPSPGSHRRIAIAVDLSDESAYAVKWAVQNYLRPGDAVILLHVRPTSVLYGADWGAIDVSVSAADAAKAEDAGSEESQRKLEDDFHAFTTTKAQDLAQPLVQAQIPFKIHIVKDHDMKERLCLEVERLGLSAVIMGSRGFGAARRTNKGRLGSVSDYCVHHCVCPVVVVRYPDEGTSDAEDAGSIDGGNAVPALGTAGKDPELQPVPEEDEFHDASSEQKVPATVVSPLSICSVDEVGVYIGGTICSLIRCHVDFENEVYGFSTSNSLIDMRMDFGMVLLNQG